MNQFPKQKLEQFYQSNKRMPSYSEMMKIFGFKSKNAVYKLVEKMISRGEIAKDHLGRLIPSYGFGEVSLLGLVKAGIPSSVEEVKESVNLNSLLIENTEKTFMLEVDGDSMIDAHIEEGDMVIAEKTENTKDGDIVIAEVDGEFTMKFLRKKGTKAWLEPANQNYSAIYPKESFSILAKVKAVIRKY